MLVLSRKQSQDIVIGDNIRITVLKVKGNTVRIGIEAPRDVNVVRGELPSRSDDRQFANVTVVFNDTVERGSNPAGRKAEVLQFKTARDETSCSISYRQVMPEPLQHNRLKQIADRISKGNQAQCKLD